MANEKRCIDANELWRRINERLQMSDILGASLESRISNTELLSILSNAPTVDVVNVVRCNDCKKWESTDTCRDDGFCYNPKFHLHHGKVIERCFMPLTKSTDFCSYGERRECA